MPGISIFETRLNPILTKLFDKPLPIKPDKSDRTEGA